jgi:Fur family peroxide stress response transcriptional regulator
LKVTHQRAEIFREVAQTLSHPDAETVLEGVRRRVPSVSLDTVYRTLWLLADLDLIRTLSPLRERARFDANLEGHHHFVCVRCGFTRDFESEGLGTLPIPAAARKLGRVQALHVEARGLCRKCASQRKSTRTHRKEEEKR